jgi:hypothetical protein
MTKLLTPKELARAFNPERPDLDAICDHLLSLEQEVDVKSRTARAWELLNKESHSLWREASARLHAVRELLSANVCTCECEHDEHDDGCERCLACRIAEVVA